MALSLISARETECCAREMMTGSLIVIPPVRYKANGRCTYNLVGALSAGTYNNIAFGALRANLTRSHRLVA